MNTLMSKDDWCSNRILWKAAKHKLFDKKSCYQFSDLPTESVSVLNELIPKDMNPVIVFWGDRGLWTVLGTRAICSFYDDKLVMAELDKINKKIKVVPDRDSTDLKQDSRFICLETSGSLIWAPSSAELFALMNILRMFPLGNRSMV